jgi:hypothetical protein
MTSHHLATGTRQLATGTRAASSPFQLSLLLLGFYPLLLNVNFNEGVNAHIYVGDPDQGKAGDNITPPIVQQQFVAGQDQHKQRDVMAKAVFAGKQVKELSYDQVSALSAHVRAVVAGFPENFFVRDRP